MIFIWNVVSQFHNGAKQSLTNLCNDPESDPFINKQPMYNMKESLEKESADSLSLTVKPLY